MCTDKDIAMDPGSDMFILTGPCSDLCRTVLVKGWACLSFTSLLVPFFAIISCVWKNTCDPAMPYISKLVRENVAVYDQSSG